MTLRNKLEKELDTIKDPVRLREIIITLCGAILNIKDLSTSISLLRKRAEKTKNVEDIAECMVLSLVLNSSIFNIIKRKDKGGKIR